MSGGRAQGHLGTMILLGVDHGPEVEATRQHNTIQGTTCCQSSCMLMETPCACNECANSIDWLTYHFDRSPSPRRRERSSPADSGSKSASPGASRSPPSQRSPSGGE